MMNNLEHLPTPCYVLDIGKLENNLKILSDIQRETDCRILLALKGFAMFSVFPQIRAALCGVAASSLNEARLGFEEFQQEVHVYAPAYKDSEFDQLIYYADHMVFNSFSQWNRFKLKIKGCKKNVLCGIRVNPEHREVAATIYDPCAPNSRFGITQKRFEPHNLSGLSGIHFHNLCELGADALERTLQTIEVKFGSFLEQMEWVNFGGGHLITRKGYDIKLLHRLIAQFKQKYKVQVYLEPGEAVVLDTGFLVATVLDIIQNHMNIAILDTSASAHMPDVIEAPYRPEIWGAGKPEEYSHTYRLGGVTCLSGDVIGDYSFDKPLEIGSKIIFKDMAHYTMVKNNTFNGVSLPGIAVLEKNGKIGMIREFTYEDYRNRLS